MGKVYLPHCEKAFTGSFQARTVVMRNTPFIELKMTPAGYSGNLYVYLDEADLASLNLVRQRGQDKMFKKGQRVRHLKEGCEAKIIQIDKSHSPPYGLKYQVRLDVGGGKIWAREDWLECIGGNNETIK